MQSSLVPKNDTKSSSSSSGGGKFDCAKECPCGVPVIPVPDQWLEVMVTGGFKVWHIIFIIIAFIVTIIVVYCCFHRCRIPRTKQEIEADLMRTNITNKFRDYLQEFPNEPTTFIEALKKVQELEEKSEQDEDYARDSGARKRMGWLKLKGKGGAEKPPDEAAKEAAGDEKPAEGGGETAVDAANLKPQAAEEAEPTAVLVVDPKPPPEASEPKAADVGGGGDAAEEAAKPRRRRKQNLSRTKRAKALDIERPAEQVAIKMTENVRQQQQQPHHHHHRHRVKIESDKEGSAVRDSRG